jgi:predicted pyridoxine 5'-phosphate oxidase superfamily flavin-nucleotide-binding protein
MTSGRPLSADAVAFITKRNSAYLATAGSEGQPYVQHRGGPAGFLRVLDERTIAFADYAGNRQYASVGNLAQNAPSCS